MNKYAERNLRSGEKIIVRAKVNPLQAIGSVLTCLLWFIIGIVINAVIYSSSKGQSSSGNTIMLVCMLIGVVILLERILFLYCLTLVITDRRVMGRVGIIRKNIIDYPIEKVDSITVDSSFWGSIFRLQTITVVGANNTVVVRFRGIKNATEFKNALTDAIEAHASNARRAQAEEIAAAMGVGRRRY